MLQELNRRTQRLRKSQRGGFTLLELFIVIVIIGILLGMLMPAQRVSREGSRRSMCHYNMRQLALASLNHESSHMSFPTAMGSMEGLENSSQRLSGWVTLLPLMEQGELWETVSNPSTFEGVDFLAGPSPLDDTYLPWQTNIEMFQCPSANETPGPFGRTNYAFCVGDMARNIHGSSQVRGAFSCRTKTRITDFSDGTSNSIGIAEIGTSSDRAVIAQYAINQSSSVLDDPSECFKLVENSQGIQRKLRSDLALGTPGRGGSWADGAAGSGIVNTVLPPNSPSCSVGEQQSGDGIYSAGSNHAGVIHVALMDGSTHTIDDKIDAGDPTQSVLNDQQMSAGSVASPYGVWGALGSINGGEVHSALSVYDW